MEKQIKIIELLLTIKSIPGLYIGTKSITRLKSFIDGYRFIMDSENREYGVNIYYDFNEWMAHKYFIREPILWDTFLLGLVNSEEKAFDLFFEELEAFLKENNLEIPKIK